MSMIVPLVRILVILDPYFAGVRAQKLPIKGHFVDAELVGKTLKNFNLATTNAILMKLTMINIFMRVETEKHLELEIQIFGLISRNFWTTLKTVTYVMHYLALHRW